MDISNGNWCLQSETSVQLETRFWYILENEKRTIEQWNDKTENR
jgi:hypothetical protein